MSAIPDEKLATIKTLYNEGFCVRQISVKTGYSVNAVYYAMRRNKIARRDRKSTAANRFLHKAPSFYISPELSKEQIQLKLIGTALYWAEGYKTEKSKGIDFTNSDSDMIVLFLRFLREVCHIDEKRIRVLLYCHDENLSSQQSLYWSNLLQIPLSNFSKPYITKTNNPLEKKRKMQYGLVHLRYMDKKLLQTVLGWIEDLKK